MVHVRPRVALAVNVAVAPRPTGVVTDTIETCPALGLEELSGLITALDGVLVAAVGERDEAAGEAVDATLVVGPELPPVALGFASSPPEQAIRPIATVIRTTTKAVRE
jgi:hypothetical protein